MQHVTLNTGVSMPILGFGVFQVPDPAECERSVVAALHAGYRLIDTAAAYNNEEAVGRAIKASGVPRDDVFVTTKIWVSDASEAGAKLAVERSLRRLQLDTIDLMLIHQPFGDVHGAWRGLEASLAAGKVRAIGVSNFHNDRVMDLITHHAVVPAVNQIETHPFFQREEERRFLVDNGVQIESWGPFAEGKNDIFKNPVLQQIADQHQKTIAQVVLRWLTQRGVVAIPKSVRPERIAENFAIFDFELGVDDMNAVATLEQHKTSFFDHRDPVMVKAIGGRALSNDR